MIESIAKGITQYSESDSYTRTEKRLVIIHKKKYFSEHGTYPVKRPTSKEWRKCAGRTDRMEALMVELLTPP